MGFALQPVKIANGSDENGLLLFYKKKLVGVLVQLSDDNEVAPGHWFLEAGFGALQGVHETFPDLEAAEEWITEQIPST
jgi:hypothetical protein